VKISSAPSPRGTTLRFEHGLRKEATASCIAQTSRHKGASDHYAYGAFGLHAAHAGSSDSSFTFVGRQSYYRDPEVDLYLLDARYYDPAAAR
jgi:hypothetical protein